MPIQAYLVWNDGTRELTPYDGALRIHRPMEHPDRRWTETVFHASDDIVDNVLLYVEGETTDITDQMAKARADIEERRWQVIRRGLGWET